MKIEVRKPTEEEIKLALRWDTWEEDTCQFPWYYFTKEITYIVEGEAIVTDNEGNKVQFGAGDWVIFDEDLECTWDIRKKIKRHYHFEEL
ncbi:MAG: cupin domain-containing protein [Bacteroidota bacterium]|nr:cupin domain-containing protein [Bacteroidota bacterium]MDP4206534.1 cupin domain-containing protein [Bacteroidota bacterium]